MTAIADALEDRLISLFATDTGGHRPCLGHAAGFAATARCDDHLLFHEFFDGDTGRGLGASHQTGWTALIINLLHNRAMRAAHAAAGHEAHAGSAPS